MGAHIYLLTLLIVLFFGAGAYMVFRLGWHRPDNLDETRPHMPSKVSAPHF